MMRRLALDDALGDERTRDRDRHDDNSTAHRIPA